MGSFGKLVVIEEVPEFRKHTDTHICITLQFPSSFFCCTSKANLVDLTGEFSVQMKVKVCLENNLEACQLKGREAGVVIMTFLPSRGSETWREVRLQ